MDCRNFFFCVGSTLLAVATGCVGHNERHDEYLPIADAGDDQMVTITATSAGRAVFDGSGSTDPLAGELTYKWSLVEKPKNARVDQLVNNDTATPYLNVPVEGIYVVSLVVTADETRVSKSDYATVFVSMVDDDSDNSTPKAKMGLLNPSYCPGEEIILDGSESMDADSDELSYNWSIRGRSSIEVPNSDKANTAAIAPDYQGKDSVSSMALNSYDVKLVVGDGHAFDLDKASFKVAKAVARISGPQEVAPGEVFTLDGGASCVCFTDSSSDDGLSDTDNDVANGSVITYEWFEASNSTNKSLLFVPSGSTLEVMAPTKSGVTIDYVLKINGGEAAATFSVTTR